MSGLPAAREGSSNSNWIRPDHTGSGAHPDRVVTLLQRRSLGEFRLCLFQRQFGRVLLHLQFPDRDLEIVGALPRRLGKGRIGKVVGIGDPGLLFLDGDLAMVVLYDRVLEEGDVKARFGDKGLTRPTGRSVLGCWNFEEEFGDRVLRKLRQILPDPTI